DFHHPRRRVQFSDLLARDPLELWLLGALGVILLAALVRGVRKWHRLRSRHDPLLVYPEDMLRNPMAPGPHGGLAWAAPGDVDEDEDRPFRAAPLPPVSEPIREAPHPTAPVVHPLAAAPPPLVQPRPATAPRPWPARP